jgi:molybdopterin-containing oxidoreductase family membrane subunit
MKVIDSIVDREGLAALPGLLRVRPADPPHQRRGKRLLQALLVVALAGAAAAAVAFLRGHHVMGTTSAMPWGILIATYVFFVALTTGLCLVSSLGHVFGFALFEPIARRALFLALVTLVVGFSVIAAELEAPLKLALYAVISPNPRSPIWWMGALYASYLVIIAAELYFLLREDHRAARVVGIVGIVVALAAHSNLGAVFGMAHARPFWYGPFVPLYFVALSLLCGAALLILVVTAGEHFGPERRVRPEVLPLLGALRQLLALFIGLVAFFTAWRFIAAVGGEHGHRFQVAMASLTGPLFVSFWLFEVFLFLALPMVILLGERGKRPGWLAIAAALPLASILVVRYNFVVAGQMLSLKPVVGHLGETLHYSPPFKGNVAGFLPYTPSLVELLVVAGAIAAATLLYVGGARALRLESQEA